jgi:hypothetical protein
MGFASCISHNHFNTCEVEGYDKKDILGVFCRILAITMQPPQNSNGRTPATTKHKTPTTNQQPQKLAGLTA